MLVDQSTLDDAGVFAFGRGTALVQTVDFFTPVVDDPYDFGQIAAANALSDVYAMGGQPLTALALLCAPEKRVGAAVLREILRGGQDKMREAGVSIVGGHSVTDPELKFGYSVTGVVRRRRLLTNAGARPVDRLVLTKPLGTGVLSTALKQGKLDAAHARKLARAMAGLNRAAAQAAVEFGAHAATDVTGFGLVGHAVQLAEASGVTLRLRPGRHWFLPLTLRLVAEGAVAGGLTRNREYFAPVVGGDALPEPLALALHDPQTSGGLLVACAARRTPGLVASLKRRRVWAVEVGEVLPRGPRALEFVVA